MRDRERKIQLRGDLLFAILLRILLASIRLILITIRLICFAARVLLPGRVGSPLVLAQFLVTIERFIADVAGILIHFEASLF
jgi:hypothetical protein